MTSQRLHIFAISTIFMLFQACVFAQSSDLDSLKQDLDLSRRAGNHYEECDAMLALANYYYLKQEDSIALNYIQEGLAKCANMRKELRGNFLFKKGVIYFSMNKPHAEIHALLDSAYINTRDSDFRKVRRSILNNMGSMLISISKAKEGVAILEETERLSLSHDIQDDELLRTYTNLIAGLYTIGTFERALPYVQKGLDLSKKIQHLERLADWYYNCAILMSFVGFKEEEEIYYLKALEYNEKAGLEDWVAYVSMALGRFYTDKGDQEKGKIFLTKALAQYEKSGKDFKNLAILYRILAQNYYDADELEKALQEINRGVDYFQKLQTQEALMGIYLLKAQILYKLKQYDQAELFAMKELDLSRKTGSQVYAYVAYYVLHQIAYQRGDYQEALHYHTQYAIVKDSVYTKDLDTKLAAEKTRQNVDAEREAREKAESAARLLQTRYWLVALGATFALFVALIIFYLYWQIRNNRKKLAIQNIELQKLNATKDKFFGIIAHDLRGPINALGGVGEQMDYYLAQNNLIKVQNLAKKIGNTAQRVSYLLDNLLQWALQQTGVMLYKPVEIEMQALLDENFSLFEESASVKNITLKSTIDGNIKAYADLPSTYTVLRNLLNNAIKYSPSGADIWVKVYADQDFVYTHVIDYGCGIPAQLQSQLFTLNMQSRRGTHGEQGTGLGLILCKELIEMNAGKLYLQSEVGKGSNFTFTLPVYSSIPST